MTSGEELPGRREIVLVASDGVYSDTVSLFVDVVIVNNNPPDLSFEGRDTAIFVEGSALASPIGNQQRWRNCVNHFLSVAYFLSLLL